MRIKFKFVQAWPCPEPEAQSPTQLKAQNSRTRSISADYWQFVEQRDFRRVVQCRLWLNSLSPILQPGLNRNPRMFSTVLNLSIEKCAAAIAHLCQIILESKPKERWAWHIEDISRTKGISIFCQWSKTASNGCQKFLVGPIFDVKRSQTSNLDLVLDNYFYKEQRLHFCSQ